MSAVSNSLTRLRASFAIRLNDQLVRIETVGEAYQFITAFSGVEWMQFWSLHRDAKIALEAAAENGMLCVQATDVLRALLLRAKLL